jgi:hypothetical protein
MEEGWGNDMNSNSLSMTSEMSLSMEIFMPHEAVTEEGDARSS